MSGVLVDRAGPRTRRGLVLPVLLCVVVALGSWPLAGSTQAATTISFVQAASADPQSAPTSVAVTFTAAQGPGDLNVVVVGWNNSTATVATVRDTKLNPYTLAAGPTVIAGVASQSIYYAKNISPAAAGTNTVTVTFTAAAAFPDIRIVEYSGADPVSPVDVTAAASGSTATSSSGTVATTAAADLLFGANLVQTVTTGPGASFTTRVLTAPDGDIAEDRMVSVVGSYSATAPVSPAGQWIMQLVAFKAATGADVTPPTAPANLTATPSGTQIDLGWGASTDNVGVTGYRVERCIGTGCATFTQIATPSGTAYSDAGLAPGTYSYRVRATDAAGNLGPYSNVASATIADTSAPTAPTSLTATPSGSQIALGWTGASDNVGVTGYLVERCQGTGCATFTQIATPSGTTYSDTGLAVDSYSYRVRATDAAGNLGPYSNVATGTISDATPPTAPTALTATATGSQIDLSWTAATDNVAVTGYRVERCTGPSCASFAQIAAPSGTTYSDLALGSGSYSYRVRATDAAGNLSPYSNVASAAIPDTTPPTAPANLTATASGSQIALGWTGASDNVGVTGYLVERCAGSGCATFTQIATPSGTTYTDPGLALGSYSYRVRATDAAGNLGPYSAVATATITDSTPPTAPANLTATPSGTQIDLGWAAASDNVGVTGYRVERCIGTGCATFTQIATPSGTTYSDPALAPGTYSYRVRATDAAGNLGPYSNVASATIADTSAPTAPTSLTATPSGSQIALGWTGASDNVGVTGYLVERCQGTGCATFTQIATPSGTTYSDTGLAVDSYSYRVRATDAAGNLGPYSNVATGTVQAPAAALAVAYAFDEGLGTTTADASGNGVTGTLQNTSWTAAGKNGKALSFNGSSSFVNLGAPASLTSTGSMTWEAWVLATGTPGDDGQIIALSNATTGWQLKTTPDTGSRTFGVAISADTTTHTQRYSRTVIALNTWYHVAGVFNASVQTLDIFVNGVLDNGTLRNPTSSRTGIPAAQVIPTGVNANIGRRTGGTGFYFIGTIDDVRVYDRALSQAEIQADMSTPVGAPADTQPPTAPSSLSATPLSATQNSVSWSPATDNVAVTAYLIERCQGAGCTTFGQIATTAGTTFTDAGLTPNTSYTYQVRARDAAGNLGPYSNAATATTPAVQPPTAPTNLTATAMTASRIDLGWTAATSNVGIASYTVQRCQGAGCTSFATVASTSGTSFSDTGLGSSTSYSYQVAAVDTASNTGPFSNVATATTLAPQPPTAPTNLNAAPTGATQISLTWTASTSTVGLANYVVQRCQGTGCSSFASIASPTSTTYLDATVTTGTSYSYRVQAVDTLGATSPFSNIASATPLSGLLAALGLNEGSGLTAGDSSGNGITGTLQAATWTASGKYGGAVSFNGASSFIDLGNPPSLTGTGSMTWEAWVFATSTPLDDGQIIALSDSTGGWQLKTTPDTGTRTFGIAISPNGSSQHTQRYSNTIVALNTWYHVAGVFDAAAGTLHLYVNGVLDDGVLRGSVPTSQAVPAAVNVNIGRRTGGFYFGGTIDEVRLYSRPLSQAEIQNDMNTPLPVSVASLSATSLDFAGQVINTRSAAKDVTLTNTGSSPLGIGGFTITGAGASSYTQTNTCGITVAPGSSCTISVTFMPTTTTTQSATIVIADNAPGNPHTISLTGFGTTGLSVSPRAVALTPISTQQFTASSSGVTWSVDGVVGGSSTTGTITSGGVYTPPAGAGTHTVTATSSTQTASATVYVTTYAGSFTRDVNTMRTGLNANETALSPANVNAGQFGKLISYPIDGTADASPLYVPGLNIPGLGLRNVVFIATEHDSVYAFDADARQGTPLWKVSFINPAGGITTVPPNDTGECCDIAPEIGITGSPVIDPSTNTLYVVAKTKENGSYFSRLHALDLTTGSEKFGGPRVIQASVAGSGDGSVGGVVSFQALRENQRAALLLSNGVVYVAYGGHGDQRPYHGWVLGYAAGTLQQTMVFCTSPNDPGARITGGGQGSGIWQSGDGLATDASGNIYFVTGNGLFDVNTGGRDYGDSFLKISPAGVVLDYFTPHDQQSMNDNDIDLGSGGVLLLPDQPGAHPHMAITAGKNGTIYVVDRDNMGHYNAANDSQIIQSIVNVFPHGDKNTGNFKAPVYWNGYVYFSADKDNIKAFSVTNGLLSTTATSISSLQPSYPGATLQVSAAGTSNAILWAMQRVDLDPTGAGVRGPGSLHAFDATNLGTELYNSNQSGARDQLDFTAKWSAPLVANGKVYVASLGQLSIFGLLP